MLVQWKCYECEHTHMPTSADAHKHSCCAARWCVNDLILSQGNRGRGAFAACCVAQCWIYSTAKRCTMLKPVFSGTAASGVILIYHFISDLKSSNPDVSVDSTEQTKLQKTHFTAQAVFHKGLWFSDAFLEPSSLEKHSPEACPQ